MLNDIKITTLVRSIFKKELCDYELYINSKEKKELLMRFNSVMKVHDYVIDHDEDYDELGLIDSEMRKIKAIFRPVLKIMKKLSQKSEKKSLF